MFNLQNMTQDQLLVVLLIALVVVYMRYQQNSGIPPFSMVEAAEEEAMGGNGNGNGNGKVMGLPAVNWIHRDGPRNPVVGLRETVQILGPPSVIDPTPGGVAIWDKETLMARGSCYERVEIHDEMIPHDKPAPHVDFLYAWYKLDVPHHLQAAVRNLSTSVTYDPLKRLIRARCHFWGAVHATVLLALYIVSGKMSPLESKSSYGLFIFRTAPSMKEHYDPYAEKSYVAELCDYRLIMDEMEKNRIKKETMMLQLR